MDRLVYITSTFAVAAQFRPEDFAEAAALGFKTIINNRPDGEEVGQLPSAEAAELARAAGLAYHYIPTGKMELFSDAVVDASEGVMSAAHGPILAYCRSGMRCSIVWSAVSSRSIPVDDVLAAVLAAGFTDFEFMRDDFDEQAQKGSALAQSLAA